MRLNHLSVLVAAGLLLSACGGSAAAPAAPAEGSAEQAPAEQAAPAEPTTEPTATPTPDPFSGEGPWAVSIPTADGLNLSGTRYGRAPVMLVLAPMYPGEQAGWAAFAGQAANQGLSALSFDFRGHGSSEGEQDWSQAGTDLAAVLAYARELGAEQIVLMGASQGATAALNVAAGGEDLAGLVLLSAAYDYGGLAITDEQIAGLAVPSLWIAGRTDLTQGNQTMFDAVQNDDKEIWFYEESSLHGTYLFESLNNADLTQRLLLFANRVTGA